LRGEVTRQATVLRDTTPINFDKTKVIPEVRPDPSSSRNDIQAMINSTLERQARSTDELLRRLVEERDEKKLDTTSVNTSFSTCVVSFTQTNPHTSGASAGGTSIPNPSAQPVNQFHS
jgi:ssRNA-specific RNase YbeY (16S rRNA maturation enzyme)